MDDRAAIRQVIDDWVIARDSGNWDRLAALWHPDGWMVTLWTQGPAHEFVVRSREAWDKSMHVLHTLGGTSVDIAGDRAVAQTRMEIIQEGEVHGVPVIAACRGRFVDAFLRTADGWRLRLRQPVYEMGNMVAVAPATVPPLNAELLARFPKSYAHIAYLQTMLGMTVDPDMPQTRGPGIAAVMDRCRRWLAREANVLPSANCNPIE